MPRLALIRALARLLGNCASSNDVVKAPNRLLPAKMYAERLKRF